MTQVPFLMGAESFLMGAESPGAPSQARNDLVVLVAETPEQRSALMARLSAVGPVLVVSSAEEAQRILGSCADCGSAQPATTSHERDLGALPTTAREVRRGAPSPPVALLAAPGLRILGDRQVLAAANRETQLTPLEFALFSCLIIELGRVWPFAELSKAVWGAPLVGDASQVHAVVKRLRRKLNALPAPIVVEAVRGIGFRAVARRHVSALEPSPSS